MRIALPILLSLCVLFVTSASYSQQINDLTETERAEVVDSINTILGRNYVFPETAEKMAELLSSRLEEGAYSEIYDPQIFAQQLTADLQSISHDLHLRVNFSPDQVAGLRAMQARPEGDGPDEEELAFMSFGNYGFQEVKMLEGNVGYLDLRGFQDASYAGETAASAMNFLSNSSALIIDLRNNGGGSPSMIQLITSYLYDEGESVHLNNFYWRPTDEHTQTWTLPYVPGKRLGSDKQVYVLTSSGTFSAAEEFTYNLKNLERATIVGETTGGGAHPGGTEVATDRFVIWVPSGRAINPITNTNWEGTGVTPDVETPREEALSKAHLMALEQLAATEGPLQQRYDWYVPILKAKLDPAQPSEEILKSYTGSYGPRKLTYKDGQLYYSRGDNSPRPLVPLADDLFFMEEVPYFRIRIEKEGNTVTGLRGLYDNGHEDYSPLDRA